MRVAATLAFVGEGGPAARGRFITIEGPDGSGKTSQANLLRERLEAFGIPVLLTREPGGTLAGEQIRHILMRNDPGAAPLGPRTDALLFNASRAQLVAEVIEPALAGGTLVIATRYADSTLAYQGYGGGLSIGELRGVQRFATGGLRPDLTILLDLPVEVGLARKHASAELTRFESGFDLEFHERVRAGYLRLAAEEADRWVIVDGGAAEEEVVAAIDAALARLPGLAIRA
jgi:dTMP kinase